MESGEDIVISGVSGRFPECENVDEFMHSLLNGVDLVTENDRRFKPGFLGTPKRSGTIPNVNKFDHLFFGILQSTVNGMDPRHRILLETVYECIVDAGINPKELRGTKTGVYVGLSATDMYGGKANLGRGMNIPVGLAANRVSFAFDFKGPSYVCDTACSTSFYAFVNAFKDFQLGEIDCAVVSALNLNFDPYETLEFFKSGILSADGYCRAFSKERDGYVRSEAIVSVLLQRKKNANRIFATILGAKENADGFKKEGAHFPSSEAQFNLMKSTYEQFNINIEDVEYFESHGTGTMVGDESECRALTKVFEKKTEPLLIGSVKTNMGHAEMSAGLSSIAKCLFIIQTGIIPANLQHTDIDTTLLGIKDGKLKVVYENINFKYGLMGLNSFGFGGANGHIVMKPSSKVETQFSHSTERLIFASGRTAQAVEHFLDGTLKHKHNSEFLALIDEIHKSSIDGHTYRGFQIMENKQTRQVQKCTLGRPIWFVYTGVGAQWATMGKDLLKIKFFRDSFNNCAEVLKPYNIDLHNMVISDNPSIFHDISNCYLAITAIEVALTDLLKHLGIEAEGYIGHSVGELACAYADGALSAEEAILISYWRGYSCKEMEKSIIRGQMIAVGLSHEEIKPLLPNGIYVACQNSSSSVTIAGPINETNEFVKYLEARGIFTKQVNSCNLALHTKYVEESAKHTYKCIKNFLKERTFEMCKWISSSVPENKSSSQYKCAEYFHNNFLNPVLFDQALKHVPENAIVVEVSSHGLLQPILKREFGTEVTNISLCDMKSADNARFFLNAIGNIYLSGGQPQLRKLYPEVTFPVSRGTPFISPLIRWDHGSSWSTPVVKSPESYGGNVTINLSKPEYSDLGGHGVHGMICMAGATYVFMVWKILAEEFLLDNFENVPVVLENLRFERLTTLPPDGDVVFYVNIVKKSGKFEIYESGSIVCSGSIKQKNDVPSEFEIFNDSFDVSLENLVLKRNDVYRFFNSKGQIFGNQFKGIIECNVDGSQAKVEWKNSFICFMENMLQLSALADPNYTGFIFTATIKKIVIDPIRFFKETLKTRELKASYKTFKNTGNARCEGIAVFGHELVNVFTKPRARLEPSLETQEFVYYQTNSINRYNFTNALTIVLQIVFQNCYGVIRKPKIREVVSPETGTSIFVKANIALEKFLFLDIDYCQIFDALSMETCDVLIVSNSIPPEFNFPMSTNSLNENGFFIYHGLYDEIKEFNCSIIYEAVTDQGNIYVLRPKKKLKEFAFLQVRSDHLAWLNQLKLEQESKADRTILLYSENDQNSGIVGFTNCLFKELNKVRSVRIDDNSETFDVNKTIFNKQLNKNLVVNILKNGEWGTNVHLPLSYEDEEEVLNASLSLKTIGDLSSLVWEESPRIFWETGDFQVLNVFYSGLNMLDIFYATGKLRPKNFRADNLFLGCEFSGELNQKRVMGISKSEGIGLQVTPVSHLIWDVPDHWSLKEASTVPFSYAMSYYILFQKAHIQKGHVILVLMATDSIGMASVSVALDVGCEIIMIVENAEQKNLLKRTFPTIKEKYIGYLHDSTFTEVVMSNTNAKGVDILLNCFAEQHPNLNILSTIKCLAENGNYIEVYPNGMRSEIKKDSEMLHKNYSIHRIVPDVLIHSSEHLRTQIADFVRRGILTNAIKPLPVSVYIETEVESAFRYLSSYPNNGKISIQMRKENVSTSKSPFKKIKATKKLYFYPDKSYILIGGTGLIGLEVTDWIIRKGAKKITINTEHPITSGYPALCLHKWSMYEGVNVEVCSEDASVITGLTKLIFKANNSGPIGGIFHMDLLTKDNIIEQQAVEDFQLVLKSKLETAINMDILTRKNCPELDHFVIFSSIISAIGNVGQSNFGLANSAIENLCEVRRKQGLPGLAIQWGPISETGSTENISAQFKGYLIPQSIASCLNVLEKFMLQQSPVCASYIIPDRAKDTSMKHVTPIETVARIMGIKNLDTVDESMTLAKLGMDSLMAVEIRQALHRNFGINLVTENILDLAMSDIKKMK